VVLHNLVNSLHKGKKMKKYIVEFFVNSQKVKQLVTESESVANMLANYWSDDIMYSNIKVFELQD